jgi:hypothetical protein
VIAYRATLDVSGELVLFTSRLLAAERQLRGTPRGSRKLTCRQQAVLGPRWFRDRTAIEALGRDHGVSRATAYRYVEEVTDVLAAQAPELPEALERAMAEGVPFVILDGKVIATDRCLEKATSVKGEVIDVWYSGKARRHGGNVQAVARPDGFPLWISQAEPGSVHDITVARTHAFPALYRAASLGMPALADSGYEGAGKGILVPVKNPPDGRLLDLGNRSVNALLRSVQCLGERAFALLTQRWRTLQHITARPSGITWIARAALVLVHFEHGYL